MRFVKAATALVVAIVVLAGIVSYSWTFTPIGRLEYTAAVIAKLSEWNDRPVEFTAEARQRANEMVRSRLPEGPTLARVEDRTIGANGVEIPLRIYWPDAEGPLPVYLDIHGGGWWTGDGFAMEGAIKRLAAEAEVIVVSVDYRLAPDHPYPAPLDDCYAALEWLYANARELGGDPERLGIGGGSAGGNLSAALALRARDQGGPPIRFQYLLIPATDLVGEDWPSYREAGERYVLKVSGLWQMYAAYAPDPEVRRSPYVSPLLADDLSGLPPALVVTAHFDPLRDQGIAYAKRLEEAGVPTQLHAEDGGLHGFFGSPKRMDRVLQVSAKAIREALHRPR
ncbi:MAG: alpha/beta hydrolase [Myxococcota bacterium]|jgi:acetyl esterase|nr:alpha/beta hydrolase [Myxococcota bacterium]